MNVAIQSNPKLVIGKSYIKSGFGKSTQPVISQYYFHKNIQNGNPSPVGAVMST